MDPGHGGGEEDTLGILSDSTHQDPDTGEEDTLGILSDSTHKDPDTETLPRHVEGALPPSDVDVHPTNEGSAEPTGTESLSGVLGAVDADGPEKQEEGNVSESVERNDEVTTVVCPDAADSSLQGVQQKTEESQKQTDVC
ncbi:hypothetical protein EGW08_007429, partial [Elysia chlorotica]